MIRKLFNNALFIERNSFEERSFSHIRQFHSACSNKSATVIAAQPRILNPLLDEPDLVDDSKQPSGVVLNIEDYLTCDRWRTLLKTEFKKPYFKEINRFLQLEYSTKTIYPPKELIFNAFNLTKFRKIKVVIIGQDPYHDDRQAHGLAFSVYKRVEPPPSLRNIFTELKNDLKTFEYSHGCLTKWAEQGVFLLNSILSVEAHKPGSHSKIGWELFTNTVIRKISTQRTNCVFLLWGNYAKAKADLIDVTKHKIIKCGHPSPYSSHMFFGSKCFSKTNRYLTTKNKSPIDWNLD